MKIANATGIAPALRTIDPSISLTRKSPFAKTILAWNKGVTMLDRLDDIPWQNLQHAYGPADDVPGLLRALAGSGERQEQALGDLFGNIWHQGTVYEASPHAVPFLSGTQGF